MTSTPENKGSKIEEQSSGEALADPVKLKPKNSLKALMSKVRPGDNGTVRWRTLKDMAKANNDSEDLDDALKSKLLNLIYQDRRRSHITWTTIVGGLGQKRQTFCPRSLK